MTSTMIDDIIISRTYVVDYKIFVLFMGNLLAPKFIFIPNALTIPYTCHHMCPPFDNPKNKEIGNELSVLLLLSCK